MDISNVVDIHLEAFQIFFLSFLGPRFLRELYYGILQDPSGIAFVYEETGTVVGFVAGTDHPSGFYRRLLKQRWWRFGLASITPALRQPAIIPRLFRAFKKPEEAGSETGCGTLMSIATSPRVQGQGVGQELVIAFLAEASRRGLISVNDHGSENNDSKPVLS
jgi:GNAT superfamily N-acetyltransferase